MTAAHHWNDFTIAPIAGSPQWSVSLYGEHIGEVIEGTYYMWVRPAGDDAGECQVDERCKCSVHRAALFLAELVTRPEQEAA